MTFEKTLRAAVTPWLQYLASPFTAADGDVVPMQADINGNFKVAAASVGVTASASFTPAAAAYGVLDIMGTTPQQQFAFTYANGAPVLPGSLIRILTSIIKSDQTSVPAGVTRFACNYTA